MFDETQVRKPSAKMGTIMKPLRKGMVSVESLMIISVGAMIFLGLAQFWNSSSQPRSKHLTEVVLGLGKEEKFKLPDFSRPNDREDQATNGQAVDKLNEFSAKRLEEIMKLIALIGEQLGPEEKRKHWFERAEKNEQGIRDLFGDIAVDDPNFVFDEEQLRKLGFVKAKPQENLLHNWGEEHKHNVKWTRKIGAVEYGDIEIILNEEDKLVTDPKVMGTYNFGSSELAHVAKDVIPYILWGNSPDDPTTPAERFLRSEYGVHRVVEAYINSKPIGRKFRDTVTNGLWYLYDKEFIDRQPKYPRT